jgi:flagellin
MGLRVNNNVAALNAYRNLSATDNAMSKSLEKLSSGLRINRAADDAAGLAISEGLRSQIGGLKVAVRNIQDGISVVQTAEGALTETHGILQRMRDLAVQAANSGALASDATSAIQSEIVQLKAELDRIAATTSFNGKKLLDGTFDAVFQVGANAGETISVVIGSSMGSVGLGVDGVDVTGPGNYAFFPGPGAPSPGDVSVMSAASDTQAAILTWERPVGTADFSGAGYASSAFTRLDGVVGFAGRTFDLSSVRFDTSADTDGDATLDSDDLLAQLNAAATSALGLSTGPFQTPAGGQYLQFFVRDAVPGFTDDPTSLGMGTALSGSPADIVRATPTFTAGSGATAAIGLLDAAIGRVSTVRADLGAAQNRFEHTVANLDVAIENLTASESRIRDADMAQEMVSFTRNQILSQAGTAMLAESNKASQGVLELLR